MSLVTAVGMLARQVMTQEEEAREKARLLYPKLLESDATDPKSVAELQRVMELIGKTASDLSTDAQVIREWRRLQGVVADGTGLDAARVKAQRAHEAQHEETTRIIVARKVEHQQLYVAAYELEQRYSRSQSTVHAMGDLHQRHRDLLVHEHVPSMADLA